MGIPEFHNMHHSGVPPQSRGNKINFSGKWSEWLPLLAWHFRPLRPLNEAITLGWYDLPLQGTDKIVSVAYSLFYLESIVYCNTPLHIQDKGQKTQ